MTLEQYLRSEVEHGSRIHTVVASVDEQGIVRFSIQLVHSLRPAVLFDVEYNFLRAADPRAPLAGRVSGSSELLGSLLPSTTPDPPNLSDDR
jgi:hypothetical protein